MQFYLSIATTIFFQTIYFNESQFVSVNRAPINAVYRHPVYYTTYQTLYILYFFTNVLCLMLTSAVLKLCPYYNPCAEKNHCGLID